MHTAKPVTYIGTTNGRRPHRQFGIEHEARLAHLYVVGRTGTGKSTLLENLALQDIERGYGLAVIDPHGDLVERLVRGMPSSRQGDLTYLDVGSMNQPYGYNPLRRVGQAHVPLAVSGLMEVFKKLWPDAWGVRMEHVLRNALYALIEVGGATLPDVLTLLTDKAYRRQVASKVKNEQVRYFWAEEFKGYHPRYRQEAIAPIQNKIGAYLADPRLYRMLVSPTVDLHFRRIMDERKILLVNLSKGRVGDDTGSLIGALLLTTLGLAGLSRADTPLERRTPFFLYVDEFQTVTTTAMASMVSELRKYQVGLTLAHQHLYQLAPEVRHAVLGNVASKVAFRVGPEDAPILAREFSPVVSEGDLLRLPNFDFYTSILIEGEPSRAFSGTTLPSAPVRHA